MTPKLNSTESAATMKPLFDYVTALAPSDPGVQILSIELPSYGAFFENFISNSGAVRLDPLFLSHLDADDAPSP